MSDDVKTEQTLRESAERAREALRRTVAKRKRGRPRKPYAMVRLNVCLSPRTYDAYCRAALRSGQPLAALLRHVLAKHAPTEAGRFSTPAKIG